MNERLMRAAPGRFAEFVTAFEERPSEAKGRKSKQPNPLWLIWKFEGDWTLWNLMQKRDFPYNIEGLLLGQEVDLPKGPQRSLLTIRLVMTEVRSPFQSLYHCNARDTRLKSMSVLIPRKNTSACSSTSAAIRPCRLSNPSCLSFTVSPAVLSMILSLCP